MDERLQKILSQWGVASRRQAEELILQGRVRLNGAVARLGQKADPLRDQIVVDNVLIEPSDRPSFVYLLLNKPLDVVSTCYDPHHQKTVLDLLPPDLSQATGLHPVGRLDANSTGALLLTNDGDLTYWLTHPSHNISKLYNVWVKGVVQPAALSQWRQGVELDDGLTRPAEVNVLQQQPSQTQLEIILQEGRKRQIRRTAKQLGHPVISLHRVAIGPISLADLPSGHYRHLCVDEVNLLKSRAHSSSRSVFVSKTNFS